jgi:RimJ/RimL family protein N-acetyltransferase
MASRRPGTIRKLFATDLPLFRDHLLRLDVETRHNRFVTAVNDAFLTQYSERCFATDAIVFAYIEDGVVRGAAELHPLDDGDDFTAEAAFSVEPALRRRGIATALFRRLITAARNRGVERLRINCLAHNDAMQALARKFPMQLSFDRWQIVGDLEPKPATPASLYMEAMDDMRGFVTAGFSVMRRGWSEPPRLRVVS